jgi:multimeric flavodoxin WrbA
MSKILVVYHSQSGNTKAAAELVAAGASSIEGAEVEIKEALKTASKDLLNCDGIAVGTPDYFGYMAGGLKDFFDRTYYSTQGRVAGKPCAIFVTHGGGGKAVKSVRKICQTFKFKIVGEPVLVAGRPKGQSKEQLIALGKALAEVCAK